MEGTILAQCYRCNAMIDVDLLVVNPEGEYLCNACIEKELEELDAQSPNAL